MESRPSPAERSAAVAVGPRGMVGLLVAVIVALALPVDPWSVPSLLVVGLVLVGVWRVAPGHGYARSALLLACGALWLTHLARIPLLLETPELFRYPLYGPIGPGDLHRVGYRIAVEAALFLVPFAAALPREAPRDRGGPEDRGFLRRNLMAVAGVSLVLVLVRVALLGVGVGFLGLSSGRLGAVTQLVPEILLLAVAVFFLLTRRPGSSVAWWFFLAMTTLLALATVLRGSKAALLRVLFVSAAVWLFWIPRVRIRISRGVARAAVAAALVWVSFGAGLWVRAEVAGIRSTSVPFLTAARGVPLLDQARLGLNEISGRLLGLDGRLLVERGGTERLAEALTLERAALGAAAQLLPGVDQPGVPMGKAVSVYASGHSWDFPNEGGVGLLASAHFLGGSFYWALLAAAGLGFGLVFRFVARIRDRDARAVVATVVGYALVVTVMSGNVDRQAALLVIALVQVVFYGVLVRFLTRALGRA